MPVPSHVNTVCPLVTVIPKNVKIFVLIALRAKKKQLLSKPKQPTANLMGIKPETELLSPVKVLKIPKFDQETVWSNCRWQFKAVAECNLEKVTALNLNET